MVTMKDVAQRARVSTATVSHVLNGTRVVQPQTRERVLAAIHELGYEMDGVARSLRVRATFTIALIIPDLSNPFFPELAVAVQLDAAHAGYDVVIYSVDVPHGGSRELFAHYLRAIRRRRHDAVIIAEALLLEPAAWRQLMAIGIPVVLIGGMPRPQADRVYIDDYAAARDVMDYLIRKGHTLIGHVCGAPGMMSAAERQRGYRDGLRCAGLCTAPDLEISGTFLRDGGYTGMQQLLACAPRPTAVFAANDLTAVGALCACLDASVRVPDDVAIVGFDDIALATDVRPVLTTVYHSQREIGQEAARLALARLRGECPEEKQTIIVPHRLVVRDSA
jgi:LacI family transcriptional regulator